MTCNACMMTKSLKSSFLVFLALIMYACGNAQQVQNSVVEKTKNKVLLVKPSDTDTTIHLANDPHYVSYNPDKKGKLFLFIPGTGGKAERGPKKLFETAINAGYRLINISYINRPAVARICRNDSLVRDPQCARHFREKRIFGTGDMAWIPDQPQDAIVNRLTKLIIHLQEIDREGSWGDLLDDNKELRWDRIVVTGQSQGGGMAAFIAQRKLVHKIITFSGGWDKSSPGVLADWYSDKSATPAERWYGTYHTLEPRAADIDKSYRTMQIPAAHIFGLDLKVREGKKAHGEAIRNTIYTSLWRDLLGEGALD